MYHITKKCFSEPQPVLELKATAKNFRKPTFESMGIKPTIKPIV